ncbi:monofunctional biosynthetic peptidoglycan transglycosylase [Rhizobium sp. S-51]|uniref:Biosynthetic peptidoglycan transglycosylase n=1 Tax=Rhizobium terricola TaxID=2728849 RepID=A0A7Y0FWP7_9HYPH|nr:monofunctional biosynthetic peptidoglycan transglycosylase [Rhizobium terricola]
MAAFLACVRQAGNGKLAGKAAVPIRAVWLSFIKAAKRDKHSKRPDRPSLAEDSDIGNEIEDDGSARRRPVDLLRKLLRTALVLLVLPYALIVVYRIDFIHPVSTLMLADLVTFQGYDRRWVDFEDISPNVVRAVMMSEDGQFCFHSGVDWEQMKGVVDDALSGQTTRGASTIPMQAVKNLYLWNSRSMVRKGLELPLAMVADAIWPKERMMEIYLNIAEWGPGIYGIEAAARHHFKTSAAKLTSAQAALLAVSLPNPIERVAGKPGKGMKRLANVVDRRAKRSGAYIKCLYE